jgi:hypothetical protein
MSQAVISNNKSISISKKFGNITSASFSGTVNIDLYTTTSQEYLELEFLSIGGFFVGSTWNHSFKIYDNDLATEIANAPLASGTTSIPNTVYSYGNDCFKDYFQQNIGGGQVDNFYAFQTRVKIGPNSILRIGVFHAVSAQTNIKFSATSFINSP